jgi:hypothetical protein
MSDTACLFLAVGVASTRFGERDRRSLSLGDITARVVEAARRDAGREAPWEPLVSRHEDRGTASAASSGSSMVRYTTSAIADNAVASRR